MIHKTAIISPGAQIDKNVEIGPYAIIGEGVKIGSGTVIGPHAHIACNTEIGNNNKISHSVSIGDEPQDISFQGQPTFVRIGDGNTIREFATIHRATKEGTATTVGNDNYIMAYAHLGHDAQVGNRTILSNGVGIAGHVHIDDKAILSAYVVVHQFCRIGGMVMIGALTRVTQDVLPYTLVEGSPAATHGLNVIGLRRNGMSSEMRQKIKRSYKILCREKLSVENAINKIKNELEPSEEINGLIDFVKASKRGFIR
ncbi:MAG: acyl-ACP--UDP-N-acetylglucosamine O-acyltransferase [Deltaproteobacteria bacterium]|nr:acyl-ACP--UDP-N-acetylglucosamine O-acyltransferase [Deltaproteobacteria bacterium]